MNHVPAAPILTACLLSLTARLLSRVSPPSSLPLFSSAMPPAPLRNAAPPFSPMKRRSEARKGAEVRRHGRGAPPPRGRCARLPPRVCHHQAPERGEDGPKRHGRRATEELLLLDVAALAFLLEYATTKLRSVGKEASSTCCPHSASLCSMCSHTAKELAAASRLPSPCAASLPTAASGGGTGRCARAEMEWEEAKNGASVRGQRYPIHSNMRTSRSVGDTLLLPPYTVYKVLSSLIPLAIRRQDRTNTSSA
jgi:hypothetical protein